MTVPCLTLNDGNSIPQFGLGVWQVDPDRTADLVGTALRLGYRHVDTAQMYRNEAGVGDGIADSDVDRAQVYITSKLNNGFHAPDDARREFEATLHKLRTDYIDLFLIHWPLPTLYGGDYVATWRVLEEFKADGRARSIGVSNFQVSHLERLAQESDTVPAVNQVEVHPYFANGGVRAYGRENGIITEAWSPIARGAVLGDAAIAAVADEVGRTPAQVVLRWHVQRGHVVFPKSSSERRLSENIAIFDFELSDIQMAAIDALDNGEAGRTGPHPDTFAYVP